MYESISHSFHSFQCNRLQFNASAVKQEVLTRQWTAFCNFHLGNYKLALDEYEKLRKSEHEDVGGDEIELNIAICMFYLGERMAVSGLS